MKFSTIILSAGLIACAAAADASITSSSTVPLPTSSYNDTTVQCLKNCKDTDVACRASCLGVPTPSDEDVKKSTECAAKCNQGSGSPEDTKKYGDCQLACYSSFFLPTATKNFNGGTTASATETGTATVSATGTGKGSSTPTGTGSGTGGAANNTQGTGKSSAAAPHVMVGGTFAGLIAAVAAALAL